MEIPHPNQESDPYDLAAQVERLHPTIGVARDILGTVEITEWQEGGTPYHAQRLVELHPRWYDQDRGPDLTISVYESGADDARSMTEPISENRVRTSEGNYQIEKIEGADVDRAAIITTAQNGIDLFEQWRQLPPEAQRQVAASKVYDAMPSSRQIEDLDAQTSLDTRGFLEKTGGSPDEMFVFIKDTVGRLEQPPQEPPDQQ
jgi:hypothetical protein